MKFKVDVIERYIEDAKAVIMFTEEEKLFCPIALAFHEQIAMGTYKKVYRDKYTRKNKTIIFLNENSADRTSNAFNVAETILWKGYGLPFLRRDHHAPINIKHSKKSKQFVIDFDKGKNVKPFSFILDFHPMSGLRWYINNLLIECEPKTYIRESKIIDC